MAPVNKRYDFIRELEKSIKTIKAASFRKRTYSPGNNVVPYSSLDDDEIQEIKAKLNYLMNDMLR